MNILDLWPTEDVPPQSAEAWSDLFERRRSTFFGFCALERERGFLDPPVSLALPKGQDAARLIMFRAIEEFVESGTASSREHLLEELIDSINYIMSLGLLDPDVTIIPDLVEAFATFAGWGIRVNQVQNADLANFTYSLAAITDKFRNRAWMANAQDVYFAGTGELRDAMVDCMVIILVGFDSWGSFWRYFVAKDNVLQFRLRTNY